jgi:outer membrane protein assembly factor BamE (lipoprotein component of BamABCDE complex)
MIKRFFRAIKLIPLAIFAISGCMSAAEHGRDVDQAVGGGDKLTVGKVQREIRVGMSGAEVATVMGSPNIVTSDEKRREVWIYDKISTTQAYSTSKGGISTLILGGTLVGSGLVGVGAGGSYESGAGAQATQQKTLTVIIKYDEQKKVRDFAYHTSRF